MRATAFFAVFVALVAAGPPLAYARRGGDDRAAHPAAISQDAALQTARAQGLARVREVKLRRGVWKIEGWTGDGRVIEVTIDAASGAVVKREIYQR